jgi:hypothetical protein
VSPAPPAGRGDRGRPRSSVGAWGGAGSCGILNFSEWDRPQKAAHEAGKSIREGEMPPWFYAAFHPDARLMPVETRALIRGFEATPGTRGGR